jgi:accessory gene regulator protein AgrB
MLWLATRIGFGIILVNIFALLCTYGTGSHNEFIEMTRQALFAIPLLLGFDLSRYARRCWHADCLAD